MKGTMRYAINALQHDVPNHLGRTMAVVGGMLFVLYVATLSPGVYPGVSAFYVSAALGFQPWDSASHPLWRLFIALWQQMPLGSAAWRLNLSSAFCGVTAAVLLGRYVACWVYAHLWSHAEKRGLPEEEAACPEPTAEELAERRAGARVAVAAGGVAAILLGTGLAGWGASTRLQPETFDLTLVMVAFVLYQDYTSKRGSLRLYALALLCGMGIAETTLFWGPTLFLAGALVAFLYRHHRLRPGLCLGLIAISLLGVCLFVLSARVFASAAASSPDVVCDWCGALRQMLRLQLREASSFLPRAGWVSVVLLLIVPWLAFQAGYWARLHRLRNYRADALQMVCLIAVLALQCQVPIPPWTAWLNGGRLAVLEAAMAAMLGGWAFAYWAYGVLFRWEPAQLVADKELRLLEKGVRTKKWLSVGICFAAVLVTVAAAFGSGRLASGRRGLFADRCAQEILDQLGDRSWLVTDGVLDPHLNVLSAARGRTLRVLNLSAECDPGQVRQMRRWVSEEPRMQTNRERLLNAASLGVGAFVREWLAVDPAAENVLALYCVPDLWMAAGLVSRPDRFLFFAKRSADGFKSLPLLEEQRAFWSRMRLLLPPVADVREPSDRLRRSLRSHLSVVANDLGVLLMDLGRDEEAFDALGESLLWDSKNLSALANRALLAGKGVRPAEKDRVEAAFRKATSFFKRQPMAFDVVRLYGQLRTPDALFGVGAAWAQLGQYGLAQGGLRRAAALAKEDGKRDAILAYLGSVSVNAGETGQGEEVFWSLLKKDARNLPALMGMLNLALRRGDAAEAGKWLAQARLAGAPEKSLALVEAQIEIVGHDYGAARARLLDLTDKEPKNLDAWALLAVAMVSLQQLDDVERVVLPKMESAVCKQPNARVFQVRGDLARARGPAAYGQARDMYRRALRLSPGRRDLLETLVDLDLRLDDQASANLDASDLLRIDPDNADGHFVLGNQAVVRGELDAAESHLRASVARAATPQTLNNLAEVLLRKGALEEAESTVRQAVAKDDKNAAIWDTQASVLLKRGKTSEALTAIGQARALAPEDWTLAFTAARIQMEAGRKEEARTLLNEVQKHLDALPPHVRDEVARVAQEWRTRQ